MVAGTSLAYVSLAGRPEVAALDLGTLKVAGRFAVADFPTGLALSRDQASLYVSHLYTSTVTITDRRLHLSAIGDAALERNQPGPAPRFDTPSLLEAWATAPYFHDGSAATLRDVLFSRNFHNTGPAMNTGEPEHLVAYMKLLP